MVVVDSWQSIWVALCRRCCGMIIVMMVALGSSHALAEMFILDNGDSFEGSIIQTPRNVALIRLELGGMRPESIDTIREVRIETEGGEVVAGELIGWADGTYTLRTSSDERIAIRNGVIVERSASADASPEQLTAATGGPPTYILVNNHPDSTAYRINIAITSLVKIKVTPRTGIDLSPSVGGDQILGIEMLRQDQAQFALVDALTGHLAYSGTGPFAGSGPDDQLRSIAALWPEVAHFTLKEDYVRSGTIDDLSTLDGKQISLGDKGSDLMRSNRMLLANLGIDVDRRFNLVFGDDQISADALKRGEIIAMGVPGWPPRDAVLDALEELGDGVRILEFTDEQLERAGTDLNIWHRFTIPAGTYPLLDRDIATIAQPNLLVVRSDVPEETVYQITKAIFDNLPWLRDVDPAAEAITLDQAFRPLPLPLHPGAERYFQEVGGSLLLSPEPSSLNSRLSKAPL